MTKTPAYNLVQKISAALMILALGWLTVSAPLVYEAQQEYAKQETGKSAEKDDGGPFSNTTEEKSPSSINMSEEYLHGLHDHFYKSDGKLSHQNRHSYDVYVAFHGELISPPPDSFLS
jgi:hypothetical protein